jgi:UPF0755 protein
VKIVRHISITIAIVAASFFLAALHFSALYYKDGGDLDSPRIEVKVAPGMTFRQVQEDLVEKGIVTNPDLFRWAAYITRREDDIQTGRYLFRYGESISCILRKLSRGEVEYTRVVIPEGLYMKEIASLLQEKGVVDSTAFMDMAMDSQFVTQLGILEPTLEGYLFPDTYFFNWPIKAEEVARRMVYRFRDIYGMYIAQEADSIDMHGAHVVILASIIQAEAVYDSEMPRISAVYHNRLRAGMRLEADPTVAYALGGVRRKLWLKDLRVESPYNTYRVKGLPPGAICSPGRSALEAAVNPLTGANEYYFVADGTGRHHFSKTYKEHLQAKHRIKYGAVPPEIRSRPDPSVTDAPGPEAADSRDPAPESRESGSLETKAPKQAPPGEDIPGSRPSDGEDED